MKIKILEISLIQRFDKVHKVWIDINTELNIVSIQKNQLIVSDSLDNVYIISKQKVGKTFKYI